MARILVYLFPVMVNFMAGGTFFIAAYRLAEAGAGSVAVGMTLAVWAAVYSVASLLVGRITAPGNAPKLIIAGSLILAADSLGFLVFDGIYTQFLWLAVHGAGFAFYCTPFQVFAKSLEPERNSGTVRSAALYTASWSIGMAIGPFVFGLFPFQVGYLVNILLGVAAAFGVRVLERNRKKTVPTKERDGGNRIDYAHFPDLVRIGWLIGGIGTVAVTIVRTMVPDRAVTLDFTRSDAGLVLAAVSLIQAVTAFFLIRSRCWMYRPRPAMLFGACGVLGLLLFGMGTRLPVFYCAAVAYGIFSGATYFCLVFHSLVHPTRSAHYVAVNEAVVGAANITGPVLGGWAAAAAGNSGIPFLGAAALVAVTFGAVALLLRTAPARS